MYQEKQHEPSQNHPQKLPPLRPLVRSWTVPLEDSQSQPENPSPNSSESNQSENNPLENSQPESNQPENSQE
jgi:hypothetical protein